MNSSNNKKELRRKAILNDDLLPLLVKTSIPTIIGMLVMVIYNLTDTFFVGILNNKSMTAAIGIVFSFMSFIQAIGFWFGYGSGNIMSKKIGENEEKEAEIISSIGILFAIVIGILIAILSWFLVLSLSKFIGASASENLLNFTVEYLKVIIISIPFGLYSITLYNQLRLCGNVKDGISYIIHNSTLINLQYGLGGSPNGEAWNGSAWTLWYEWTAYLGVLVLAFVPGLKRYQGMCCYQQGVYARMR